MKFLRYGSLNGTKYKNIKNKEYFHCPPCKKGIYAFPLEYEEPFLWVWKIKNKEGETEEEHKARIKKYIKENRRVFEYDGPLWCHFIEEIRGKIVGSWVLTDTGGYQDALSKVAHNDTKGLVKCLVKDFKEDPGIIINPYKRGLGGFCSKDHLEVFIQKKYLGRIR